MKKTLLVLSALMVVGMSSAIQAQSKAGQFTLSSGAYFSTGDYTSASDLGFEQTTEIFAAPLSLKYSTRYWSFSVSTAYIRVQSDEEFLLIDEEIFFEEDFLLDEEDLEDFEVVKETFVREGIGDTLLNVNYRPQWRPFFNSRLQTGIKVKLPTSDSDKGFGTGETDFSLYGGMTYRWRRLLIDVAAGYQFMGDPDDEARQYQNRWFGSLGASYLLTRHFNVGGGIRYKMPSREGRDPIRKLNGFVTWRPNTQWRYTLYTSVGLSDTTADIAAGLQMSYQMD